MHAYASLRAKKKPPVPSPRGAPGSSGAGGSVWCGRRRGPWTATRRTAVGPLKEGES